MTDRPKPRPDCPEGEDGVSRREFVRRVAGTAVAGGLLPLAAAPGRATAAAASPASAQAPETAVKRFFDSLKDSQRKVICFPFDHPLRTKINANWAITEPKIDDFF